MHKSLIIETYVIQSIVFKKESFINAKKVLNFKQSLTNEKKVIKSLRPFHTVTFPVCYSLKITNWNERKEYFLYMAALVYHVISTKEVENHIFRQLHFQTHVAMHHKQLTWTK